MVLLSIMWVRIDGINKDFNYLAFRPDLNASILLIILNRMGALCFALYEWACIELARAVKVVAAVLNKTQASLLGKRKEHTAGGLVPSSLLM